MLMRLLKCLFWIPLFGNMVREAIEGPEAAMYMFVANMVMATVIAVILFGFPALITVLLTAVACMFMLIFDITRE